MNQDMEIGKYEFHPNKEPGSRTGNRRDRIEWLMEELIRELKQFRRERNEILEYTDEELEASYRELANDEEAEAKALEWIEGTARRCR